MEFLSRDVLQKSPWTIEETLDGIYWQNLEVLQLHLLQDVPGFVMTAAHLSVTPTLTKASKVIGFLKMNQILNYLKTAFQTRKQLGTHQGTKQKTQHQIANHLKGLP